MTVLLFLILFLTYINQIFPLPGISVPDLTNSGSYGYRAGSELLDGKNSTVQTSLCNKVAKFVAYQILVHSNLAAFCFTWPIYV
jgi:hypothetical protein